MSGLQRSSPRLKARASPYHSGVTLFAMPDASSSATPPRPTKRVKIERWTTPHPTPPHWREVYDCIKEMRSQTVAPVDTMGCHMAQRYEKDPKVDSSTLVSLMLSPQTKDQVTDAAVSKLRTALGGSVSLDAVLAADPTVISEAINKVGMWRVKTKHLKLAAEKLRDDFDSDVPQTIEGLISLPGVGPKIGFLALQNAWNINVGIGVDAENPEDARISLESWLPAELQPEINPLLVGFGQTICPANSPRCGECKLGASGLCPSAKMPTKKKPQAVPDW
ncbi:DNA glycosylase [Mycena olivaceomarginata]|nr:DNA glycosylase [Mycena olivaceomarginata]